MQKKITVRALQYPARVEGTHQHQEPEKGQLIQPCPILRNTSGSKSQLFHA